MSPYRHIRKRKRSRDANPLPQDILDSSELSIAESKVEMAVHLCSKGRLSIGKALELAKMPCGNSASYWLHAASHPTTIKPIWNKM
jgi:hypothetical protein